jgi:MoaA/NifB/PqqE/SkfB family radical SAM enzyme
MSKKDTWCIYPFVHLATFTNGDVTPCCVAKAYNKLNLHKVTLEEAWNHPSVKEVRQKMINGESVRNCQNCYSAEEHGVDSHRTSSNRVFEKEHGLTRENFNSAELDISKLFTLDLRLGNTCNLKCIMCRPNESHKWIDDVIELKKLKLNPIVSQDLDYKIDYNRDDYNWINNKLFWDNIDNILPNIKEFIFGGGEPFMLKEVKELLKKAVDMDLAKNLTIRFHTNGTYLTEKDFELLQHFKRIQLMFSIDGVNELNYFLRFPAKWDSIIKNINENEKYGSNIESYILCSLTSVSSYYLDQLYDFVHRQQWKKLPITNIILGRVHHPIYLNPQTLDSSRKNIIDEKWKRLILNYPASAKMLGENLNWILGDNFESTIDETLNYLTGLGKVRSIDLDILKDFFNGS